MGRSLLYVVGIAKRHKSLWVVQSRLEGRKLSKSDICGHAHAMQSPSQDFDMAIMDSLIAEDCTDFHSSSDAASAWWAQAAEKYSLTQVLIKQHH